MKGPFTRLKRLIHSKRETPGGADRPRELVHWGQHAPHSLLSTVSSKSFSAAPGIKPGAICAKEMPPTQPGPLACVPAGQLTILE